MAAHLIVRPATRLRLHTSIRIIDLNEGGLLHWHGPQGLGRIPGVGTSTRWVRAVHGEPADFKPIPSVGPGAYEIRVQDEAGAFRVIYVAKFEQAVYVLHALQKKTRKTVKADIELAARRYTLIGEES